MRKPRACSYPPFLSFIFLSILVFVRVACSFFLFYDLLPFPSLAFLLFLGCVVLGLPFQGLPSNLGLPFSFIYY